MRIKYSVVIPALFIGFCGVFIIILYITEKAKQEEKEKYLKADEMYKLINQEGKSSGKAAL